jgi:hypothetical protein
MKARGHPTPGSWGPNREGSRRLAELLAVVHRPLGPGAGRDPILDLSLGPAPGPVLDPSLGPAPGPGRNLGPNLAPSPDPGLDPGLDPDPGSGTDVGVRFQGPAVLAAGEVEEDAGAEGEEEEGPDPLEA